MSIKEPRPQVFMQEIRVHLQQGGYSDAMDVLKNYGENYAAYAMAKVESNREEIKAYEAAKSDQPDELSDMEDILLEEIIDGQKMQRHVDFNQGVKVAWNVRPMRESGSGV